MKKYPQPSGQTPDAKDVKCYCIEKIGDNARCPKHGKTSLTSLTSLTGLIGRAVVRLVQDFVSGVRDVYWSDLGLEKFFEKRKKGGMTVLDFLLFSWLIVAFAIVMILLFSAL